MKDNDKRDLEIIANRKRFVHELRTTNHVQARGTWYSPKEGSYCAMGLYYYVVKGGEFCWTACDRALGLSAFDVLEIWSWNDSGSSFAEIADKFERKFGLAGRITLVEWFEKYGSDPEGIGRLTTPQKVA